MVASGLEDWLGAIITPYVWDGRYGVYSACGFQELGRDAQGILPRTVR